MEMENLSCVICTEILINPVTLNCGHSFCRHCVKRALKTKPVCPSCRHPTLGDPDNFKENILIKKILEKNEEYQQRIKDFEGENENKVGDLGQMKIKNDKKTQEKEFQNLLSVYSDDFRYFPNNFYKKVKIQMKLGVNQFQQICQDQIVVLTNEKKQLGVKIRIQNLYQEHQSNPEILIDFQCINRVKITKIELINEQVENQNDTNIYSFEVAQGLYFEDQFLEEEEPEKNQILTQQTLMYAKGIMDFIILNINKFTTNLDNTTLSVLKFMEEMQIKEFSNLINPNQTNVSLIQLENFCFRVSELFHFNEHEITQLFESQNLLEKYIIIDNFISKFHEAQNPLLLFNIQRSRNPPQSKHSQEFLIIIAFAIIFVLLKSLFNK